MYCNYFIIIIRGLYILTHFKNDFVNKMFKVIFEHAFINFYIGFIIFLSIFIHRLLEYNYYKPYNFKWV